MQPAHAGRAAFWWSQDRAADASASSQQHEFRLVSSHPMTGVHLETDQGWHDEVPEGRMPRAPPDGRDYLLEVVYDSSRSIRRGVIGRLT